MPLLQKNTTPLWGVWKIEEPSDLLLSLLRNRYEYSSELAVFRTEKRLQEWLATRTLLQELLGEPVRIAYHPNGAPYLAGSPLHISISHTKGYAAVLLQDNCAAGIDIEYRSDRILKIRSRFMTPEEEANIDKKHETDHLLLHWCAKETLFKMIGQEEVDFCKHLHVCPFSYAKEGTFTVIETRTPSESTCQLDYLVTPDFVLTWNRTPSI